LATFVTVAFKRIFRFLRGLILVFGLLSPAGSAGQSNNIGIPPVRNFPRKIYQAGTQSWDVGQDRRGVIYFANNNGLLQYDGRSWQCFPVSNGTIVRSLLVHTDGRIYVGAQGEVGYFFPDQAGRLAYHSLMPLVPESGRNLEDVWDIQPLDGAVFFRSNQLVL
jgi:hypothetical protein